MADVGLRGTNANQDTRFKDKEAAAVKATKFPKSFNEKVDLRKVNISVLRPWIAQKITELIRFEDDVVVEYVYGMLEDKEKPNPDPKKMQVSLLGFMDKYGAAAFMEALWNLLLSAQNTVGGVPAEFIAAKKAELERKQVTDRQDQDSRSGRPAASDSFDRRDNRSTLPVRPGGGPAPNRDRDDGYRRGPPRRFEPPPSRDQGYGNRGGGGGFGGPGRPRTRSRSRSPPGRGYRRRSPSPRRPPPPMRRRSPSPPARRRDRDASPLPPRQRSPSPVLRRREVSPPPARRRRSPSRSATPPPRHRDRRDDTPPLRRDKTLSPPRRRRDDTPSETRSRSRSRSPTVTPPRRGARDASDSPPKRRRAIDSPPPRQRERTPSISPPARRRRIPSDSPPPARRRSPSDTPPVRRRRSPSDDPPPRRRRSPSESEKVPLPPRHEDDDGVVRKGRGKFAAEEGRRSKLEGGLAKSKWAMDD